MSVKELSHEEIEKMSMVDVANLILVEEKQPLSFLDTFNKVAALKEWDNDVKKSKVAQFYTDLNMDGRFITNGSNTWGLKRWYKLDEISEELTNPSMEVLDDEFEDEDSSFLKVPGFDDEKNEGEDDDDDEDEKDYDGFDDPDADEEGYDDEFDDDEDGEDFGEDYDEDDED
ncbi:MAG TPA: DNA-directed RNA polymerase subunit delta [Bacillota bacterium]|nr:DNA-directed RNA polymerase subunit delta [Bacillota bacterium]